MHLPIISQWEKYQLPFKCIWLVQILQSSGVSRNQEKGEPSPNGAALGRGRTPPRGAACQIFPRVCCWQPLSVEYYSLHDELAQVPKRGCMLKPLCLSVVVSNAMLARVTIVKSPIPIKAGRTIANLFTPSMEKINRKATALSCQGEGGR